jgi:putative flippase GtrA
MMQFVRRTGRYAQVGLVCALLSNAIVIGLDRGHIHYAVSVIVAYFVGTLVGYLLHSAYTYRVRASRTGWLRFVTANLSGLVVSMILMFILCDVVGLTASMAIPIATVLLFAWNYLLTHMLIGRSSTAAAGLPG